MSDEKISALKDLLEDVSTQEWLSTLQQSIAGKSAQDLSISGKFATQALTFEGYDGRQSGGFFARIDAENRDAAIQELFSEEVDKGQWLIDYLDNGTAPQSTEQQQFVQSYDDFMVGLLDSSGRAPGTNVLKSYDFKDATLGGDTLTDSEFALLIHNHGFDEHISAMGSPLGKQWVMFTGSVAQAAIDIDHVDAPFNIRYSEKN